MQPTKDQEWQDHRGRLFRVLLLDENDPDLSHGLVVGPPLELEDMDLPEAVMVRLHNELYHRGILTEQDAISRAQEVESALKSAYRVDAGRVMEAYRGSSD